ncbi:MAG: type II toxin-antitoxin system mRNA interferase toxin, RelE/StbE family [Verrucomicrobia bacterium]|nr:type II toxin-antitoxin system mRNA interferase toxin, RelE/StbE family [Verrucomicrobiota bacterium]
MKLVWSAKFTRSTRKLSRRKSELLDQLEGALHLLEREPYHPALRTHKLSGDFEGCWACSAGYDLRIVFEFVRPRKGADMEIHLLNVGTHDEVY